MKIMYILFSFTIGGTERLVADICNEMTKRGNRVFLYIINDLIDDEMIDSLNQDVNIELQKRNVGGRDKIKTVIKITEFIRKNRIDVVHCNSFNVPELLFLHPIAFRKTGIVQTIHDVGQYANLNLLKIKYRNWLCDSLIAISESVKNDIIKEGAHPDKVITVYNAINLGKFIPNVNKTLDKNRIVIGNVARIVPEKKGQDILIKAIARVKETYPCIYCYFAGDYDRQHELEFHKLLNLIYTLDLKDHITFLGNINDIPGFLDTIDIFVLPSRFEGFGIALIEAMAMGIPCVASDLDGPAELIGENGHGYLFAAGDSEALAERLVYVIKNFEKEKKNAQDNIGYVHQNFDIKTMCSKLLKVYKKCK